MTSPAFDTTFGIAQDAEATGYGAYTTLTFSFAGKTAGADEVICFAINYNNTYGGPITSFTESSNTLKFALLGTFANGDEVIEVWTATAAAQFNAAGASITYTAQFKSTGTSGRIPWAYALFAVNGLASLATNILAGAPDTYPNALMYGGFIGNGGGMNVQANSAPNLPPPVEFSVAADNLNVLAVAFTARNGYNAGATPSGWTNLMAQGTAYGAYLYADYELFTSAGNETYQNASATDDASWMTVVVEFAAEPSPARNVWTLAGNVGT